MEKKKNRYYAVRNGHRTGIFDTWLGDSGAKAQVDGYPNATYRGFATNREAEMWLNGAGQSSGIPENKETKPQESRQVTIYTDGGCLNNPGPGGYGVVMMYRGHRKELSGGFRKTTNNRMELTACIAGLSELKKPCSVLVYSDSQYVVNGIEKGWAKKWQKSGWMRTASDPAENYDLWETLLKLCDRHAVSFKWVKGHSGIPENERCDELAGRSAEKTDLPPDTPYEKGETKVK